MKNLILLLIFLFFGLLASAQELTLPDGTKIPMPPPFLENGGVSSTPPIVSPVPPPNMPPPFIPPPIMSQTPSSSLSTNQIVIPLPPVPTPFCWPNDCQTLLNHFREKGSINVSINLRHIDVSYIEDSIATEAERLKRSQDAEDYSKKYVEKYQGDANFQIYYVGIGFSMVVKSERALQNLLSDPDIRSVIEDLPRHPALNNSVPRIGAPAAWTAGAAGAGQAVVVMDGGFDNHPFFASRVAYQACFSGSTAGTTSLCPNGQTSQLGPYCPTSTLCYQAASNCFSFCDHGDSVAGVVVGGKTNVSSTLTIQGAAPSATVILVQVYSSTGANVSDEVAALQWVNANLGTSFNGQHIAAVNLSLSNGYYYSSPCDSLTAFDAETKAILALRNNGIPVVVASGNDGYKIGISAPACISSAVSVGATNNTAIGTADPVWTGSDSDSYLTLLAPGCSILSSTSGGTYYAGNCGTSMAAPHVAAAFALLRSKFGALSVDTMVNALQVTGEKLTDTNGITKSRIQVDSAISYLTPAPPSGGGGGGGSGSTSPSLIQQIINWFFL